MSQSTIAKISPLFLILMCYNYKDTNVCLYGIVYSIFCVSLLFFVRHEGNSGPSFVDDLPLGMYMYSFCEESMNDTDYFACSSDTRSITMGTSTYIFSSTATGKFLVLSQYSVWPFTMVQFNWSA